MEQAEVDGQYMFLLRYDTQKNEHVASMQFCREEHCPVVHRAGPEATVIC